MYEKCVIMFKDKVVWTITEQLSAWVIAKKIFCGHTTFNNYSTYGIFLLEHDHTPLYNISLHHNIHIEEIQSLYSPTK